MSSRPTCSCLSCPDHSRVLKDLATRTCPSSLSDAQWELIAPLLPAPASSAGRGRRPEKWPRRLVLDAVFYVVRGGIPWHALPAGFPPGGHRLRLLRALQPRRVWRRVHDALREQERAGRGRDPSHGRGHRLPVRTGITHRPPRLPGLRRRQADQRAQAAPGCGHQRAGADRAGHRRRRAGP